MSALTDFLHKLVDKAGVSELHSEIDDLEKGEEKTEAEPVAEPEPEKEDDTHAAF